jgi:hypothetical protein
VEQAVADNPNDPLLTQYLLGALAGEETERLDELSIADDDFAARLNSAEKDLVDAYVRGELPAAEAAQFKSAYLSSPKRRDKVRFAETLFSFQQRSASRPVVVRAAAVQGEKHESAWARLFGTWFGGTRFVGTWFGGLSSGSSRSSNAGFAQQWGLAGAALLLLIATGFLLNTNLKLRQQVSRSESERALLAQREQQLQHQLAIGQATNAASPGTEKQNPQPSIDRLKVAAFVLVPTLRGSGPPPTVARFAGIDLVVLKLELESNGFSTYQVAIQDSATRGTVWQSAELKPFSEGEQRAVSFVFPADLLKARTYVAQLKGIRGNGVAELVSSYPFRSVIR